MMRLLSQLASIGSFGVGVLAVNVGVGGLNCAPSVYGKFELSGHNEKDVVKDPKFSLKFGNAASSAMFIHALHYEVLDDDDVVVVTLSEALWSFSSGGRRKVLVVEARFSKSWHRRFVHRVARFDDESIVFIATARVETWRLRFFGRYSADRREIANLAA